MNGKKPDYGAGSLGIISKLPEGDQAAQSLGIGSAIPPKVPAAPVAPPPPPPVWQPPPDPYAGNRFQPAAPGSGGLTQTPMGWDMSSPGVAEQFWNQHQQNFINPQDPSVSAQYWNQLQGRLGQNAGTANLGQQAYEDYQRAMPMLPEGPGLDPYYDRAKERAQQSIDQAMASRGAYGSSAATGAIGSAFANLDAEQANREASYALDRSADMRNWATGGGQLALGASGMGLNWLTGMTQADLARQGFDRQNWMDAMLAAQIAQNARRGRVQDRYGNQMGMLGMMLPTYMSGYQGMLNTDMALQDAALGGDVAAKTEAQNQQYRRDQNLMNITDWGTGQYNTWKSEMG